MRGAGGGNPTRNLDRTDRRPAPLAHEYERAARNGKTALSVSGSGRLPQHPRSKLKEVHFSPTGRCDNSCIGSLLLGCVA